MFCGTREDPAFFFTHTRTYFLCVLVGARSEGLAAAPCVKLGCGHLFHRHCVEVRVAAFCCSCRQTAWCRHLPDLCALCASERRAF